MARPTAPSMDMERSPPPPPYTISQQMKYPEMRDQGFYLNQPGQVPVQQPYRRPQQQQPGQPMSQQQQEQQRRHQQQQQQHQQQQQQQRQQQQRHQQQQQQQQQQQRNQQPAKQKPKKQKQQKQQQQQQQQRRGQQQQPQQQQQQHRQQQPRKRSLTGTLSRFKVRRAPPGVEVSPCIKYTMFFLNMIFWLLGVFLLGFGIWGVVSKALVSVEAIAEVAGISFDPMYGFIIVGAVIFILATSGCIGALRENTCMLKFFAYTMILIFLAEIAIGVLAYFYQDNVFRILEVWLDSSIKNYYDDPDTQFILDGMQTNLQCCGSAVGPADWEKNMYFSCDSPAVSRCSVPYSCCVPESGVDVINYQCGYGALEPQNPGQLPLGIFLFGCVEGMKSWFISNAIVLGIAGGVLIIMECLVICMAKSLVNDINCVKSYW